MGGSGGGGPFTGRTPEQLARLVRDTEDQTAVRAFETELSRLLSDLLASANTRDVEEITKRLDAVKVSLQGPLEGTIDSLFGGSVAKHTYVDGLSDIDSLLIVNESSLKASKPADALQKVADI